MRPRNWRAYELRLSTYMRCPSAKSVSKASDDFPEPDKPVITTSLFRGMATLRFLRLLTRDLLITMYWRGSNSSKKESFIESVWFTLWSVKLRYEALTKIPA